MPTGRGERRQQFDASRQHVVVVGDEPTDLDVVAMRIDVEMPLDRVRLTAGHRTILAARNWKLRVVLTFALYWRRPAAGDRFAVCEAPATSLDSLRCAVSLRRS